ncbi:MAG TPA: hypothetical protein PK068_12015, partial [Nitrosomonas sp.]|nr:hypothetical protein [Nitrosomonas sp.]
WTFHCTPTKFKLGSFSEGTSKALTYAARMSHALSTEKSLDLTYRTGVVIATASELVFPRLPDMHKMFLNLLCCSKKLHKLRYRNVGVGLR